MCFSVPNGDHRVPLNIPYIGQTNVSPQSQTQVSSASANMGKPQGASASANMGEPQGDVFFTESKNRAWAKHQAIMFYSLSQKIKCKHHMPTWVCHDTLLFFLNYNISEQTKKASNWPTDILFHSKGFQKEEFPVKITSGAMKKDLYSNNHG